MSKKIYILALILFIIDQISKAIISTYLKLNESIVIIKDFFYLRYINNTGASFGMLSNSKVLLITLSIIAIIIILRYINSFKQTKLNFIGFGLVLGGILGNLSDRILFGYVKDFLDFIIFNYDFPVFNLADIFIVIGVIMLIISILRGEDKNGSKSSKEANNERLDKYLSNNTELSRTLISKMIDEEFILVNNKPTKSNYKVKENDLVTIDESYKQQTDIIPEKIDLDIVFEDDDIIIINKPSGMVVHPGNGNFSKTLVNGLMYYTNNLSDINGEIRPGIVHRIDKDTSGLIIIAKNNKSHEILSEYFQNKTITRNYIALIKGEINTNSATIDAPIGRSENDRKKMAVTSKNSKNAITHLNVLKRYKGYTLVKLKLDTGRTHQIRVHMSYIGHPVYNDPVYTNDKCSEFGQFLHSYSMDFIHPITKKEMHFECELPEYFRKHLECLEEI